MAEGILHDTYTLFKREMIIFRSRLKTNLIRTIMFPLILIIFFGNVGSAIKGVQIAVVNGANNAQSLAFISSLESSGTFTVEGVTNEANGMSLLRSSSIAMLVVIAPSFPHSSNGAPSIYIYYSTSAFTEISTMSEIAALASKFGASASAFQAPSATSGSIASGSSSPVSTSSVATSAAFGGNSSYKNFIVAGIIIMVAVFGAMFGGGMTTIMDRQLGNLKAFLITPINKIAILLGKITYGTVQAVIYGVLALFIGLLFGATVLMGAMGYLWILVIATLISLGFSGMTTMLASRISRVEIYAILANTITLPLWFLSGAFLPTTDFPSWLQVISIFDPMTYAVQGIRYVMILGYYPMSAIILDMSVLAAFTVTMLGLSFVLFKTKIE